MDGVWTGQNRADPLLYVDKGVAYSSYRRILTRSFNNYGVTRVL